MQLHQIDSIQELRKERLRLEQEADVARELLHLKVQTAIDTGKRGLLGSWKAIIPIAITAGLKQFSSAKPREETMRGNAFFDTFQEGFKVFQGPSKERWVALLPIIIRLWEQWQEHQMVSDHQSSSFQGRESASADDFNLREEKPVSTY